MKRRNQFFPMGWIGITTITLKNYYQTLSF
jgi:hypothetical protein